MELTRAERRERFNMAAKEPEFLEVLCDRIADGETLVDITRGMGANFRWMYEWLNDMNFPERREKYNEAENARDASMKEDIVGQIHRLSNVNVKDMFDDSGNLKRISDLSDHVAKAVASIDVTENEKGEVTKKIRMVDKGQMLTLGGRRQRMFVDRVDVSGQMSLEQAVNESMKPRE